MESATPDRGGELSVRAAAYALLLVLGALEGLLGCFHYSGTLGPVPAAALAFAAAIFLTCVLAAWGMQTPTAWLCPLWDGSPQRSCWPWPRQEEAS